MNLELLNKPWDTTLPNLHTRRVWTAPALKSHSLLLLTSTKLFLVPASETIPYTLLEQLIKLPDPATILPQGTLIVLLPQLHSVEFSLLACSLQLSVPCLTLGPQSNANALARNQDVHIVCQDAETADELFSKLLHRTNHDLQLETDLPDLFTRVRTPVGLLAGILLATVTLAITVSAAEDLAMPPADPRGEGHWYEHWVNLLKLLDWRWIMAFGGINLAWAQVMFYRRWRQAPQRLFLLRRSSMNE